MRATIARSTADIPAYDPNVPADWATHCLNCGAALYGHFCSDCGQRALPPHPTIRELVGDALSEFLGVDGSLATTVRKLIGRPGQLTRDVLEGRRRRYVSPLRVYLSASVLYFLVASAAPSPRAGAVQVGGLTFAVTSTSTPSKAGGHSAVDRVKSTEQKAMQGPITAAERDSALAAIIKAPRVLQPVLRRVVLDPQGFKHAMSELFPRVLFAIVPVFALIVGLFYRGRHYPEHLYLGLHNHAFVFVALTLAQASKFAGRATSAIVGTAVLAWIAYYVVESLRRVYGGSVAVTILKAAGIAVLYSVAFFVALASGVSVAALVR